jgi:hypothetical protein
MTSYVELEQGQTENWAGECGGAVRHAGHHHHQSSIINHQPLPVRRNDSHLPCRFEYSHWLVFSHNITTIYNVVSDTTCIVHPPRIAYIHHSPYVHHTLVRTPLYLHIPPHDYSPHSTLEEIERVTVERQR